MSKISREIQQYLDWNAADIDNFEKLELYKNVDLSKDLEYRTKQYCKNADFVQFDDSQVTDGRKAGNTHIIQYTHENIPARAPPDKGEDLQERPMPRKREF